MSQALLVSVYFHDGRHHGQPEWPPAPARLFQALVAAAAEGAAIEQRAAQAFRWLERLCPPLIVAPAVRDGTGFVNYVPNNNLDAVGRDPARVSEIRVGKLIKPRLFDAATPLLYAWTFAEGDEHAAKICEIATRLYQLGRGVDMAWAVGEVIDEADLSARLDSAGSRVRRPSKGGEGETLRCPEPGSFASLAKRYEMTTKRFSSVGSGKKVRQLFTQAPKPRFAPIPYDSPQRLFLYELREPTTGSFAPWPLTAASILVERLRDAAAQRLKDRLPDKALMIDRVFIGRGSTPADTAARIRIIPLPSIGSVHVVRSIRRVLIEVPPDCPLPAGDIGWAFSGLDIVDPETGEVKASLVPAVDDAMLKHYGVSTENERPARIWRTVTPAALPQEAARRRIDPKKLREELRAARSGVPLKEAKGSRERLDEERRASVAVRQALRHTGVAVQAEAITVQREPFEARGARAEAFADGTRFAKERLWHVEIAFANPVSGPLVIGDGRYLGLGILAPPVR